MAVLSSLARSIGTTLAARLLGAWLKLWLMLAPRDGVAARRLMAHAIATRDPSAARQAGAALLQAGDPDAALIADLGGGYLRVGDLEAAIEMYRREARIENDSIVPGLYRNAYMVPARAQRHEPYVHVLRDVTLETEDCAVFDGEKVYIQETSGRNLAKHPYVRHRFTPDLEFFVVSCPAATMKLDAPFVLLGTDGGTNYSHWLFYVLKLALLEEAGVSKSLPLLLNDRLTNYQLEWLDLLDIPRDRVLPVPPGIVAQCLEVVVPIQFRNHPAMRQRIDWLRRRLARLIAPVPSNGDRLFVSRRDSPNHVLLNESEIEEALASRGFTTIIPGQMSVADQVRRFSRARVIVAPHGAALTNLFFAPPGTAVVEITSTHLHSIGVFRHIIAQMGMEHLEIISDRYADVQPARYHPNYNYYADAANVIEAVDVVLNGAAAR